MLEKILVKKREEVKDMKRKKRSLKNVIENNDGLAIIAEIKRASPSKGDLNLDVDIEKQARIYENSGASAISVLTDQTFFKGSFEDLERIRQCVELPILCKEFILDEIQIYKAKSSGADIILLIVAALSSEQLRNLYQCAINIGLEVIVEVHNEKELQIAKTIKPDIIGINNRNLKTFQVDLKTTEELINEAKKDGTLVISESGISSFEDAKRVRKAGADGILVGEAFMTASSIKEVFHALRG